MYRNLSSSEIEITLALAPVSCKGCLPYNRYKDVIRYAALALNKTPLKG
jgi:hypothetical protein